MPINVNFSVIIPAYNNFELFDICVASIPDQADIEVIIIDDLSDEIQFHTFKSKIDTRNNVRVFRNKENKGAGFSRNFGVNKAVGRWLIFADADDEFMPEAFLEFNKYKNSDAEIVYFDSEIQNTTGGFIPQSSNKKYIEQYLKTGKTKFLRTRNWEPWGKMFSREFVIREGLLFHEIAVMNDAFFTVSAGIKADKIDCCCSKVYIYKIYGNSISRKVDFDKSLVRLNEILQLNKLMLSVKGFRFYTIDFILPAIHFLLNFGFDKKSYLKRIIKDNGAYFGIPVYHLFEKIIKRIK